MAHRLWVKLKSAASRDIKSSKGSLTRLQERNRDSQARVVAPGGPVVSMTSYGKRLESVYLALESIGMGSVLPSRLVLWLDDELEFERRPETLRRLEARGLEVRLAPNVGPHSKYYPYLCSESKLAVPLVTADDDTLYPERWLKGLAESYAANPEVVSCYRAHVIRLAGNSVAEYVTWRRCRSVVPSYANFATGVSGVLYPPKLQERIKAAGMGFLESCPKADDVWLHVQAVRGGFMVKQVKAWQQMFAVLPGTQEMGLMQSNVHGSQNDIQIRRTYTKDDVERLRSGAAD